MKAVVSVLVLAMAAGGAMAQGAKKAAKKDMTFFVTSAGKGDGANYGGLEGADAYCNTLAKDAGSKHDNWKAYLSKSPSPGAAGTDGVNARERIGKGPWYNAKGQMIAKNLADLHSEHVKINKQTALTDKGEPIKGRGDTPNEHDILTGSDPQGRYSTAGGDTTCGNWTKNGEGSAILGHVDRMGLNDAWHSKQWNSSHASAGCSQQALVKTGGAGHLYCFAPN